ncbi:MAG: helix-turn-helix transcriptional regulator [Armatimonadetes bacterium]|nr:helix-turn-helix transcriptional regulator [Armatimonadota bacterium]
MRLDDTVDVLKALSDATRLRLLALLDAQGTLCVCELEARLAVPQYSVSHHLGILRKAGLVQPKRDGARVDYTVDPALPPPARRLVEAALALCDDAAEQGKERARRAQGAA